ncbi:MAG TPA: uroporphyrinogen-III synthase [Pseudonocardia sp.]|nr:uroporphyrinogen-III synthase [Pseudonocardia sp.]
MAFAVGASADVAPLAGFTVGVTAARRAEELGTMLERRGAVVQHGPAIRIVPLSDDTQLLAASRALIARPPDITVATTGIGFRGWVEAADGWGIGEDLLAALGSGELIARGPKARGAIRASGLADAWSPPSESSAEVLDHLLDRGVDGARIAVQLHGEPLPDVVESLTVAGAEVVEVPVYRWVAPADLTPLDRLTDAALAGGLDALAFTSAPAAASLLARSAERGLRDELLAAMRGPVVALCVGPVTAAPLEAVDVPTVQPRRSRLGAMVRRLEAELPARARRLPVAGHWLELRGHAVLVDGDLRAVPPAGMALLRSLARRPGRVVSRAELLRALPGGGGDEHAVETAMARLRSALGEPRLVQTVVKRGYRLALDPAAVPAPGSGHCLHGESR